MRYLVGRSSLLLGTILLLIVGMLAYARRNAPDDWIIYAVNQNSSWWEFYRMRPDGTERTELSQSFTGHPLGQAWLEDGWLTVTEGIVRDRRTFKLMRLDGLTKRLIEGDFEWVYATPFLSKSDTALLTVYSDVRRDDRTTHQLDLRTYRLSPIELPATYYSARTILDNGDMIVWSDHASAGDFYRLPHDTPSRLIPLTTRGDILSWWPQLDVPGWIYFYATTPQLSLYRMRENGSDEQLIAADVLLPDGALELWETERLFYWAGDENDPHLVRANLDGSEPTILPIPFTRGWQVERLDDAPIFYYLTYPEGSDPSVSFTPILHQLNVETGEDTTMLEGRSFLQVMWTPDQQFLLVWAQRDEPYGNTYELLRMRPDGSEPTLVLEDAVPFADELANGRLLVMGPGGSTNNWLRTLDLETFEIRELKDGKPRYANRVILGTIYAPDADSQAVWLVGTGLILVGVGVASTRLPPFRQRA